ncbi:MAG: hypothetical protein IPH18_02170 [Chitinophagaceae bacterium]|nr:hypothetical protein [Chitinophagaceae bacterium]MBK8951692.1 hypothetical protein [Chitinophagaceae bacterium]
MKKLLFLIIFVALAVISFAQDTTRRGVQQQTKKELRRQKVNELIRQAEEGVLVYEKQSVFGVQFRNNGYGAFFELGRMKTNRRTNIYRIDITEIKHPKEEKSSNIVFFGNPYIYGKLNNFYQVTLGYGQQYILGQKGNKNGVAVTALYNGGLALGLLRPYYVEVEDPNGGENKLIKYSVADSSLFLGPTIVGSGGLGKGWNELKLKPGAFAKAGLRFDYGRFNEVVTGIEIGLSGEFYASKIPIYFGAKEKQFFFQAYIALLFGQRK